MQPNRMIGAGRPRRRRHAESGLTLIEMMIALVILGVILGALAASLISFVRAVNVNEQKLLANQVLNQVVETFQAEPFDLAGNYQSGIAGLDDEDFIDFGTNAATSAPTFESNDVVVFEDEEPCSPQPCEDEDFGVPAAQETVTNGGFDFEVHRVFTWVDRSGDGIPDVKRLTVFATWEVLGRPFRERSDSERLATTDEAGVLTDVRVFPSVGPRRMALEPGVEDPDGGATTQDIRVYARFTQPVLSATVDFYEVESVSTVDAAGDPLDPPEVTLERRSLALTPLTFSDDGGIIDFELVLPQGQHRFTDGFRFFKVEGLHASGPVSAIRAIEFTGDIPFVDDDLGGVEADPDDGDGGSLEPDPDLVPVAIQAVSFQPAGGAGVHKQHGTLRCNLTVRATVDGMYPGDGSVTMNFVRIGGSGATPESVSMVPTTTPVAASGQAFERTFASGDTRFSVGDEFRFEVEAIRDSDGMEATPVQSAIITFDDKNC